MHTQHVVLAAALIAALIGCGDDDDSPRDAGRMDAGTDAGAADAGATDSGTADAAASDGGADAAMDASADGGDPFAADAGDTIEIRDGAISLPDSGGRDAGTVPITIAAAITRAASPLARDAPAVLEIATLSFYPIELRNPRVNPPSGWHIATVTEDLAARACPTSGSDDRERCRQHFVLELYPDGACRFDGSDFVWTWDVACAPGGDCTAIPSSFDTFAIAARPMSEDFCAGLPAPAHDAFFPSTGLLVPTTGIDPVTLRFYTTIDHPYVLGADRVVPPTDFTLVSFTEDESARECDTASIPDGCRQWWDVVVDPGTSCSPRGTYVVTWNVTCDTGGNCNPAVTEYTARIGLAEDRDLCP